MLQVVIVLLHRKHERIDICFTVSDLSTLNYLKEDETDINFRILLICHYDDNWKLREQYL